ncbi:acylphosphatase-2 isoform X8 [Bubalus kerabau]|nr:acylphosphatase-2 isoform X8 [Bubalus carabanensis]
MSHHSHLPHLPSIHFSGVNSSPRPGIAPHSPNSSSQPLCLPGDPRPCTGKTPLPFTDLNHSYQGQEQHIKSTSFQGTDDWNTPRKSWLSKVGSPSSRIDRTNFSNEKTISKLEYSSFNIRY